MSTVLTGRLSLTVWVKDFSLKPSLSPPSAHFCIIVHPQRSRSGLSQQSIVKSIEWRRLGHSVRLKGDRCDVSLVADLTCAIMPSRFMTEINMTGLQQRKVDYKCVLFIQTLPITTQMNPPPLIWKRLSWSRVSCFYLIISQTGGAALPHHSLSQPCKWFCGASSLTNHKRPGHPNYTAIN